MTTPTYIAKRVGNDYKIVRTDTEGVVLSSMTALGGGLLLLNGLLRRGLINKALGIAGAGIAYYGLTGKNPIVAIQELLSGAQGESEEHGPSFQHDEQTQSKQIPEDDVDEASMESFPASDAPARSRSTASV